MASLPLIAALLKASTVPCGLLLIILLLNSSYCAEAENILYPGETLYSRDSLTYGYNYTFRMQSNGDLVLYEGETAIWASDTGGIAQNCHCKANRCAELVIYDSDGESLWMSPRPNIRSSEDQIYLLILQKDRNVALYGPAIWATKTAESSLATLKRLGRARPPASTLAAANDIGMIEDTNTLYSRETLYTEEFLAYGKRYRFIMQSNCDLVLYDIGIVVWASETGGIASHCSCTLLTDRTLAIDSPTGDRKWNSTGSSGKEGNYVLILQRDRNVVIYGPSVWATGTNKSQLLLSWRAVSLLLKRIEVDVCVGDGIPNHCFKIT